MKLIKSIFSELLFYCPKFWKFYLKLIKLNRNESNL